MYRLGYFARLGRAIRPPRDRHFGERWEELHWLCRWSGKVPDLPDLIPHQEPGGTENIRQPAPTPTKRKQSACGACEIHPLQPYFALHLFRLGVATRIPTQGLIKSIAWR